MHSPSVISYNNESENEMSHGIWEGVSVCPIGKHIGKSFCNINYITVISDILNYTDYTSIDKHRMQAFFF